MWKWGEKWMGWRAWHAPGPRQTAIENHPRTCGHNFIRRPFALNEVHRGIQYQLAEKL